MSIANPRYKTVIFDLDGTLLYTLDDLRTGVNLALEAYSLEPRSQAQIRRFVGNGIRNLMTRSVASAKLGHEASTEEAAEFVKNDPQFEDIFAYFRKAYAEHQYDTTRPYEGIDSLVETLQASGVRTAIVSNKIDSAVKNLNDKFFHMDVALGDPGDVEGAPRRKPYPDLVWSAMEQLGADASSTVYVGDSEVDILTASNSKLDCLIVLWGFRDRKELEEAGAEVFAENTDELATLILG